MGSEVKIPSFEEVKEIALYIESNADDFCQRSHHRQDMIKLKIDECRSSGKSGYCTCSIFDGDVRSFSEELVKNISSYGNMHFVGDIIVCERRQVFNDKNQRVFQVIRRGSCRKDHWSAKENASYRGEEIFQEPIEPLYL